MNAGMNAGINGRSASPVSADVSSVGDGIFFLGYKSSFSRTARGSCMSFTISCVFMGIITIVGIVLAVCISPIFWFFALALIIMWVAVLACCLVNGSNRRDTEIYMNSQTRLLIIKSQRTPGGCFDANQENREFSLDLVQSIDQTPVDVCCGGETRQVGFTVTFVTGESYSPIRPYFNHSDIGHLQEFLRNFKLGQFGAGPVPAAAAAAIAANTNANAQAALWAYPPNMLLPQGYPTYPSIGGAGVPSQAYYPTVGYPTVDGAGVPSQAYYPTVGGVPPQQFYPSVGLPPPVEFDSYAYPPEDNTLGYI